MHQKLIVFKHATFSTLFHLQQKKNYIFGKSKQKINENLYRKILIK